MRCCAGLTPNQTLSSGRTTTLTRWSELPEAREIRAATGTACQASADPSRGTMIDWLIEKLLCDKASCQKSMLPSPKTNTLLIRTTLLEPQRARHEAGSTSLCFNQSGSSRTSNPMRYQHQRFFPSSRTTLTRLPRPLQPSERARLRDAYPLSNGKETGVHGKSNSLM